MITVSGKCMCAKCEARTGAIYRMVGSCVNCGLTPVLRIFRAGDKASGLDCPVCHNYWSVKPHRLASDDEIPEADDPSVGLAGSTRNEGDT